MWKIQINKLVIKEDFKKIPLSFQKDILKAIRKKLTFDPKAFGKPLQGKYLNYWRLRVRNYRVIYRIVEKKILVLIVRIGIRTDDQAYKELFSRLKKLN